MKEFSISGYILAPRDFEKQVATGIDNYINKSETRHLKHLSFSGARKFHDVTAVSFFVKSKGNEDYVNKLCEEFLELLKQPYLFQAKMFVEDEDSADLRTIDYVLRPEMVPHVSNGTSTQDWHVFDEVK